MMRVFDYEKEAWDSIFGIAWGKITEFCREIGGFLMLHETKNVLLDDNARALSGLGEGADYDSMLKFLGRVTMSAGVQPAAQIVVYNEKYTAGILKGEAPKHEKETILPVCDVSQMVIAISRSTSSSLLALLDFQMSDGCEPSKFRVFEALTDIIGYAPKETILSAQSNHRFWLYVPEFSGIGVDFLLQLQEVIRNSREPSRYITFTAGIGAEDNSSAQRMRTAEFALYEAGIKGRGSIIGYSREQYEINKSEYEKMSRFLRLINDNLFVYHFQPIVSARNGEILAYEMLMRSDSSIGMYPLEILDCAEKANRLYDIESATMSNSLAIIEKSQDIFKDRRLFVNSITAHMLSDNDWGILEERYGELMEKMVIEFTEQTEIDDESIEAARRRLGRRNIRLAIDDYGTGYSNTSNLIRYNPDYVKIDRSLIEEIHTKPKVKKLVSGIIEFIHENGYLALAEGVETYEELQTMIQLGSDLIQGYYVSKPKPVMLLEVSENVRRDIETIYASNSVNLSVPYHTAGNELVELGAISSNYSSIVVDSDNVTIKGAEGLSYSVNIIVKNGISTTVTLENVNIDHDKEYPVVSIGDGSEVRLIVKGRNELKGKGVFLPQTSSLHISGGGVLKVVANNADCFAIGAGRDVNPGNIVIEMDGKLFAEANGDFAVAIGGGKNTASNVIRIIGGEITVNCSGRSCVGIGIADGNSIIDMEKCRCDIQISAPDVVALGSFRGKTDIEMKNFRLEENLSGINIAGVGTIENGTGRLMISSGTINAVMKARIVNCIGSRGGNTNCHLRNSEAFLYCEGGSISGVGDMYGSGDVIIEESQMDFEFNTGEGLGYGSRTGLVSCVNSKEEIRINA